MSDVSLLQVIIARAGQLLGTPHGFLYLVTPDASEIEMKVGLGLFADGRELRLRPGEGLCGRVWLTGEALAIADYDAWEGRSPQHPPGLVRASVAVPLRSDDRVVGVVGLAYGAETQRAFSPDEVELLASFAQLASIALDNAQLLERERTARDHAERLLGAAHALAGTMDRREVLARILTELGRVVPYDSASVWLIEDGRFVMIAGSGFPNLDELLGEAVDCQSPRHPNREVVESRAPVILDDAPQRYPVFAAGPHAQVGVRSWIGTPLLFAERLTGMLALDKHEPGFYTADHARIAFAFAAQAAIAVENARLYAAAQQELADRTRAQAALEASEARHRALIETATDLIYRTDTVGRFLYVNPMTQRVFGFTEAELLGRNFLEFVRRDCRDRAAELYARQYLDLVPHTDYELPIVTKDGREVWLGCSVQLLLEHDAPVAFQSINRDITERKRAEQALRESEERNRAIVETAYDAFVSMDAAGRIVAWNAQAEASFGWPRDEVVGRLLAETIIPPRYREAHTAGLARLLATGEGVVLDKRLELEALRRDGREFPVELTISAARAGASRVFNAFIRDIRDRKAAEQMRTDLTHTLIHDLRNPLTSTRGFLELLKASPGALSPAQQEMLEIAFRGTRKVLALINDILDVSRLESGVLPLERERVDVLALVAEAVDLQGPQARDKGLRVDHDVAPGLPAAWVDPGLVSRVMQNLLGNAIKFTPPGGAVRVVVRTDAAEADRLRVSVADTGPGIPADVRRRLFEKFVTGQQAERGTGLGLAFCRLVVEAHGGSIWAEDGSPGTVFQFTLPAA